jgi:hypothetical protein
MKMYFFIKKRRRFVSLNKRSKHTNSFFFIKKQKVLKKLSKQMS